MNRWIWVYVIGMLLCAGVVMAAWDKTKPAGTTPVSQADDYMRANWAVLEGSVGAEGIGAEHQFTAGDQAGYHLEGSARATIDTAGNQGAADTREGRLYYETDTTRLEYADDADTWQLLAPKRNITRFTYNQLGNVYSGEAWANLQANITHDFTTTGGAVLIHALVTVKHNIAGRNAYFALARDGTKLTSSSYGQCAAYRGVDTHQTVYLVWLDTGIADSAGTYTYTIQAKVAAGGEIEIIATFNCTIITEEV